MTRRRISAIAPTVFLAVLAALAVVAIAVEEDGTTRGVPYPDISKGRGDSCVEDTEFMLRNHMDLLKHQRDETMREGIRTKQYSLKECIDCHAVPDADGTAVTIASPKHFCRSCHDYAAVQIDCFQCHASRPDSETT